METTLFLFVNASKTCQLKINDSKIQPYSLSLENVSKTFIVNSMVKSRLNEQVHDFYVDYNIFDISYIIKIHNYLMKQT